MNTPSSSGKRPEDERSEGKRPEDERSEGETSEDEALGLYIPDVLASRYASPVMIGIWSPEFRVRLERQLWIVIMEAQKELGVNITQGEIDTCKKVFGKVSLKSIKEREFRLRHDLKARLEEFCELAGHQKIHLGLTSRDITDNTEQRQLNYSATALMKKTAVVLKQLANLSEHHAQTPLVARTHNVPAQPSSVGKRLASFGEPLLRASEKLLEWRFESPLRGIKGAVGTSLDLISLLPNGKEDVLKLEEHIAKKLAFGSLLNNVGQVYPRELDLEFASLVYNLTAPLASLATTFRLMAGEGLWLEGFNRERVGSTAMPHKMNAHSCERICGLHAVLSGYLAMCTRLAGNQWNEGDVSCSVVRRVALPGLCLAADGLLGTFLTVLNEMSFNEEAIGQEFQRELPMMSSSTLLMEAVKRDGGREAMHELIKQHALATTKEDKQASFAQRLGGDDRFPLSQADMEEIMEDKDWLALAPEQAREFARVARQFANELAKKYPAMEKIMPQALL